MLNGGSEHPQGPGHRGAQHTNPALSRVKWVSRVLGRPLSAAARARARAGPPLWRSFAGPAGAPWSWPRVKELRLGRARCRLVMKKVRQQPPRDQSGRPAREISMGSRGARLARTLPTIPWTASAQQLQSATASGHPLSVGQGVDTSRTAQTDRQTDNPAQRSPARDRQPA